MTRALALYTLPLAVAASPSQCAMHCMAVGATQMGNSTHSPNSFTFMSRRETSRSMRGRSRYLGRGKRPCLHGYIHASHNKWSVLGRPPTQHPRGSTQTRYKLWSPFESLYIVSEGLFLVSAGGVVV